MPKLHNFYKPQGKMWFVP